LWEDKIPHPFPQETINPKGKSSGEIPINLKSGTHTKKSFMQSMLEREKKKESGATGGGKEQARSKKRNPGGLRVPSQGPTGGGEGGFAKSGRGASVRWEGSKPKKFSCQTKHDSAIVGEKPSKRKQGGKRIKVFDN